MKNFGSRVGHPLADETIRKYEYGQFLKMREKQREEARNSGLASVKVKIFEIIFKPISK